MSQVTAMPEGNVVAWIRRKFILQGNDLDERGRRRWAATEALSLGRGGIVAVAEATRLWDRTIRDGLHELTGSEEMAPGRPRRPGAGRKARADEHPPLSPVLAALGEPTSRGDPVSPLRGTGKNWGKLADALAQQGFAVSHLTVGPLLKQAGYRLPAKRTTRAGKDQPERHAQFGYLNRRGAASRRGGRPAISVDPKKQETRGHKKNGGRE